MENKVKRGLGIGLLGLPLWLIGLALTQWDYPDGLMEWVVPIATIGFLLAGVLCVLAGFVLLVWGLLRD